MNLGELVYWGRTAHPDVTLSTFGIVTRVDGRYALVFWVDGCYGQSVDFGPDGERCTFVERVSDAPPKRHT